jgi:hypothetical protein
LGAGSGVPSSLPSFGSTAVAGISLSPLARAVEDEPAAAGRSRLLARLAGLAADTSASQYGQIVHARSSGLAQFTQRSLSLRRQLGQRMKSRSMR